MKLLLLITPFLALYGCVAHSVGKATYGPPVHKTSPEPYAHAHQEIENFLKLPKVKRIDHAEEIPPAVQAHFPGGRGIAGPNDGYNESEQFDPNRESHRLVLGALGPGRCLVVYDKGGFLPTRFTTLFAVDNKKATPLWSAIFTTRSAGRIDFRKAYKEKGLDERVPDPSFFSGIR